MDKKCPICNEGRLVEKIMTIPSVAQSVHVVSKIKDINERSIKGFSFPMLDEPTGKKYYQCDKCHYIA